MAPAKASLLLGAVLATTCTLLFHLIMWAISRAPLYIIEGRPWPLDVMTGEMVAFCSCAVVSVLVTCFAMELQTAPLRAIAERLNAPHPCGITCANEDTQFRGASDVEFLRRTEEAFPLPRQGEHHPPTSHP